MFNPLLFEKCTYHQQESVTQLRTDHTVVDIEGTDESSSLLQDRTESDTGSLSPESNDKITSEGQPEDVARHLTELQVAQLKLLVAICKVMWTITEIPRFAIFR